MLAVQFTITTDAAGAYTSTSSPSTVTGQPRARGPLLLYAVEWVDTDFDAGVDALLSVTDTPTGIDKTLLTLTNADAETTYYPRHDAHDETGAAIVDGTDLTGERVKPVVHGTLKLAVTNGGNVKTGKCIVYLDCP